MNRFKALTVATLVLTSALALAQTPPTATPRVDARQDNQEKRIEQGVAQDSLTPRETRRLEREKQRISKAETRAKADGTVTAKERHRLHKAQDAASRDIAHQKHDAQRAVTKPGN